MVGGGDGVGSGGDRRRWRWVLSFVEAEEEKDNLLMDLGIFPSRHQFFPLFFFCIIAVSNIYFNFGSYRILEVIGWWDYSVVYFPIFLKVGGDWIPSSIPGPEMTLEKSTACD